MTRTGRGAIGTALFDWLTKLIDAAARQRANLADPLAYSVVAHGLPFPDADRLTGDRKIGRLFRDDVMRAGTCAPLTVQDFLRLVVREVPVVREGDLRELLTIVLQETEEFAKGERGLATITVPVAGVWLRSPISFDAEFSLGPLPDTLMRRRLEAGEGARRQQVGFLYPVQHKRWTSDPAAEINAAQSDAALRLNTALQAFALCSEPFIPGDFPSPEYVTIVGETWLEPSSGGSTPFEWHQPGAIFGREISEALAAAWVGGTPSCVR